MSSCVTKYVYIYRTKDPAGYKHRIHIHAMINIYISPQHHTHRYRLIDVSFNVCDLSVPFEAIRSQSGSPQGATIRINEPSGRFPRSVGWRLPDRRLRV